MLTVNKVPRWYLALPCPENSLEGLKFAGNLKELKPPQNRRIPSMKPDERSIVPGYGTDSPSTVSLACAQTFITPTDMITITPIRDLYAGTNSIRRCRDGRKAEDRFPP